MNSPEVSIPQRWMPVFFAIAACSWMPHWSCHYYKLETGSSFIVGSLEFGMLGSSVAMFIYSGMVVLNVLSTIYFNLRLISALLSGVFHITLAFVHISRLLNPFDFVVFGYNWSMAASVREIVFVLPFGILCIAVALLCSRQKAE